MAFQLKKLIIFHEFFKVCSGRGKMYNERVPFGSCTPFVKKGGKNG